MEKVPVWVTNFVFDYGTGALMISPFSMQILNSNNHASFLSKQEREQNYQIDYRFSLQCDLPIRDFIFVTSKGELRYTGNLLNYANSKEEAVEKVTTYLVNKKSGFESKSYHLRDWVFSRQRY